ncbi:response regulator [Lysobacter korlensis]|uniref:Response regulator n=1 Tax=Lysobacter korlensis TaxID=553636 RepID=A0ABV6RW82_9GAMM
MTGKPVRVVLVDDQTLVRQGLRSLLSLTPEVEVVGEAADGRQALSLLEQHQVDVLLLDLRPGRDGFSIMQALRDRGTELPVLVLTAFDDERIFVQALQAGARGYMLKDVTLDQLVSGVRCLAMGGTILQPAVTERLLRAAVERPEIVEGFERPDPLSRRELDVLRLAAAGSSNREIAQGLHLAEGTVKNHMSSVMLKLGVRSRTRAVLRALERGMLSA